MKISFPELVSMIGIGVVLALPYDWPIWKQAGVAMIMSYTIAGLWFVSHKHRMDK
jgi:hypothetical protein